MKVLVCGGRNFDKYEAWNWLEANCHRVISEAFSTFKPIKITKLIHGGAKGADEGAAEWGVSEPYCKVIEFKADWKKHGKAAGPIRNQKMIDQGKPDLVIAFPGGRGTADMVRRATQAGIAVWEVS